MSGIGNTPRKLTVLSLEARKSFAFGLQFKMAESKEPLDLTGATIRFVMATPKHRGGAVLIDQEATLLDASLGIAQFELQAADLDLAESGYPFVVTLVSALGYSTVILKGEVDLRDNTDPADDNVYASVNPSTNLAVYLENGGLVKVEVSNVDGLYVIVSWLIEDFRARMQAMLDAAEAAADRAESLTHISTQDELVSHLVKNVAGTGPLTSAAVEESATDTVVDGLTTVGSALHIASADIVEDTVLDGFSDPASALYEAVQGITGTTLAFARNDCGQGTSAANPASLLEGTAVTVPPTNRDVWVYWGLSVGISVAGQGSLGVQIMSGAALVGLSSVQFLTSTPTGISRGRTFGMARLGPSSQPRAMGIKLFQVQEGSSLATYAANRLYEDSWIAAVAQ